VLVGGSEDQSTHPLGLPASHLFLHPPQARDPHLSEAEKLVKRRS
jgi:hypothetical protein